MVALQHLDTHLELPMALVQIAALQPPLLSSHSSMSRSQWSPAQPVSHPPQLELPAEFVQCELLHLHQSSNALVSHTCIYIGMGGTHPPLFSAHSSTSAQRCPCQPAVQ
jgi:hypothetical protein